MGMMVTITRLRATTGQVQYLTTIGRTRTGPILRSPRLNHDQRTTSRLSPMMSLERLKKGEEGMKKMMRVWLLLGPLLAFGWLGQGYADPEGVRGQDDGTVGIIPASPQSAEKSAPDPRAAVVGAVEDARAMTKVVAKPHSGPGNPDAKPEPQPDSWPWWVPNPEPSVDPLTWPERPSHPTLPPTQQDPQDNSPLAPVPNLNGGGVDGILGPKK